jgi:hypothetical protein
MRCYWCAGRTHKYESEPDVGVGDIYGADAADKMGARTAHRVLRHQEGGARSVFEEPDGTSTIHQLHVAVILLSRLRCHFTPLRSFQKFPVPAENPKGKKCTSKRTIITE